jgi:hypothetical protein
MYILPYPAPPICVQGERRHVATLQSEVKQLKADTDTIIKDLNNDLKKAKQCPITLKKLEDAENANLKLTKENKALKETAEVSMGMQGGGGVSKTGTYS